MGPDQSQLELLKIRNTKIPCKDVIVTTLLDIKKIIFEMQRVRPAPTISAVMDNEEGKKVLVTASTNWDYTDMLMEGMNTLRKRAECLKIDGAAALFNIDGYHWVDDLIKRRLGGKRDGLRIRWDIKEGVFYYDPFTCRLTKAE